MIKDIHKFLATEIAIVNDLIVKHLEAKEDITKDISHYLISAGGKRLRPILTILVCQMFGHKGSTHLKLAAAVELIHAATLLHDDVVDKSHMRRFKPTANLIWGNKASILVGDYLFSQSFSLMVKAGSMPCLQVLSNASSIIIQGEISQLIKLNAKESLSFDSYIGLIEAKTAQLFAAAAEVGAIISQQNQSTIENISNYGLFLGKIFQITDDLLDYFGNTHELGKEIGNDFYENKVTLPIIFLRNKLTQEEQVSFEQLWIKQKKTSDDLQKILILLTKYDIKNQIINYLHQLSQITIACLDNITISNEYKDYLYKIVSFALSRDN